MITEVAVVRRRDGTESRYGREPGRKMFLLLGPAGEPDPLGVGYSRRRLEERPVMDRGTVSVAFERTRPGSPNSDSVNSKEAA